MERSTRGLRRWLAGVLVLGCVLSSTGCEYRTVSVELTTFFTAGVDELWFWRLDDATDQYVRSGHLRIEGMFGPPGRQVVQYTMVNPDGTPGMTLSAPAAVRSDSIVADLNFARWANAGWFRVSSRNRAGESPLSAQEVWL